MELWEIKNTAAYLARTTPQSSQRSAPAASEYSKILAAKISNVKQDVRAMEVVREQLDEICDMHEELTGNVKVNEDSGNANRDDNSAAPKIAQTETVKRFLPDGSIMLTTYKDGQIAERVKLKPHMIVVPDYSAPPTPDGSPDTKLKPTNNFYQVFPVL